nr:NUDIX hydrolase [uncultured Undibacterium sp.]
MSNTWKPSVTVAAIVPRQHGDRLEFLMIEETTPDGVRLNQAAGHLDPNESLVQAVIRETMEETAHEFVPEALVGTYMSKFISPNSGKEVTYLRFAFCGKVIAQHDRPLDHGILRALWMTYEEILACQEMHRSPLILKCLQDYLAGQRAPLNLMYTHPSVVGVEVNENL